MAHVNGGRWGGGRGRGKEFQADSAERRQPNKGSVSGLLDHDLAQTKSRCSTDWATVVPQVVEFLTNITVNISLYPPPPEGWNNLMEGCVRNCFVAVLRRRYTKIKESNALSEVPLQKQSIPLEISCFLKVCYASSLLSKTYLSTVTAFFFIKVKILFGFLWVNKNRY